MPASAWAVLARLVAPQRAQRWTRALDAQTAWQALARATEAPAGPAVLAEFLAHPAALATTRDVRLPSGPRDPASPPARAQAPASATPSAPPSPPDRWRREGRVLALGVVVAVAAVALLHLGGLLEVVATSSAEPRTSSRCVEAAPPPLEVRRVEVFLPRPPPPAPRSPKPSTVEVAPVEAPAPRRRTFYEPGGVLPLVPATTARAEP